MDFPIAEIFLAPQGEGFNVGVLMVFVRLAGCTVGKPWADGEKKEFNVLNNYQMKCTVADGREFVCDTDYQVHKRMTYEDIRKEVILLGGTCKQICLTGGEPLMHAKSGILKDLVHWFKHDDFTINLETSGTISVTDEVAEILDMIDYIAVSPKKGFLYEYIELADEFKLLVDENFDLTSFPFSFTLPYEKVFLQPINYENAINMVNMNLCLDLQKKYPELRISSQSHKQWGTR
jgi:organic radical activating enzyme